MIKKKTFYYILAGLCVLSLLITGCNDQYPLHSLSSGENEVSIKPQVLRGLSDSIEAVQLVPFTPNEHELFLYRQQLKDAEVSLFHYGNDTYDPIKKMQEQSIFMNFFLLYEKGGTFMFRTQSFLPRYLTATRSSRPLLFGPKISNSRTQEFLIKTYPPSSGIQYTIHSVYSNQSILGAGVLTEGGSKKYYAALFPYDSNTNFFAKNWRFSVDKKGVFKIINRDAFIHIPPKDHGYGTFISRAMEMGVDFVAELNAESEENGTSAKNQSFMIESVKKVSISKIEYLDDKSPYGSKVELQRLSDAVIERAYTNNNPYYWETTVRLDDILLDEESNFNEYKGISFNISDADSTMLKTPEVFGGKFQKTPSINSDALSLYTSHQKVQRRIKDLVFRFEMPRKSRAIVTFNIPRYRVTCPYKLTLKLEGANTFLTVYGYWSGIVHAFADAGDPDLVIISNENSNHNLSTTYRLPLKLAGSNKVIKLSTLKKK